MRAGSRVVAGGSLIIDGVVEFYDRRGSLLKTLNVSDYSQYLEKFWRAKRWMMTNHRTGKETELLWEEFVFANGYEDKDFNRNSLARAR